MPRGTKDGSIFRDGDRFIVRRRYTDSKGVEREKKRVAKTDTEARRKKREIDREIEKELAGETTEQQIRTVSEAICHCKEHNFKPPVYVGDTKVGGQRTWRATWNALKPFDKHFGSKLVREVTHEDLQEYREQRLLTPIVINRVRYERVNRKRTRVEYKDYRQRTIASVDRELAWARRVFSIAKTKKWIAENPFKEGDALISMSMENRESRILSFEEERRLFAAFKDADKRSHLPFAVLMALETAMRKSEQFRLDRERDVDLDRRLISALSYKGKRTTRRYVPITEILLPQLVTHLEQTAGPEVFDIKDPKKSFANSCRDAGIEGVTWHTLRHTAITRMVHIYKIPPHDVMKISGHTNWNTFSQTYVNLDEDMVRSIGASIDAARAALVPTMPTPETVSDAIN